MKKTIALLFFLAILISNLTACQKKEEYTVAIGIAETVYYKDGVIKQTVAGIVTDKNGTVMLTRLDALEYSIKQENGEPIIYVPLSLRDDDTNDSFEAAANYLEEYSRGKAATELASLTPDDIGSSANGYTADLIRAISKALTSEHTTTFKSAPDLKCGVSLFAYAEEGDEKGTLTLGVSYAAIAAEGGRIMGAVIDENELTVALNEDDGKIASHTYKGTKLEQGENYMMDEKNPYAIGEWYEQAEAYSKSLYYKPTDRLETIPDGTVAGCTISTENYRAAVIKASRRVR